MKKLCRSTISEFYWTGFWEKPCQENGGANFIAKNHIAFSIFLDSYELFFFIIPDIGINERIYTARNILSPY